MPTHDRAVGACTRTASTVATLLVLNKPQEDLLLSTGFEFQTTSPAQRRNSQDHYVSFLRATHVQNSDQNMPLFNGNVLQLHALLIAAYAGVAKGIANNGKKPDVCDTHPHKYGTPAPWPALPAYGHPYQTLISGWRRGLPQPRRQSHNRRGSRPQTTNSPMSSCATRVAHAHASRTKLCSYPARTNKWLTQGTSVLPTGRNAPYLDMATLPCAYATIVVNLLKLPFAMPYTSLNSRDAIYVPVLARSTIRAEIRIGAPLCITQCQTLR